MTLETEALMKQLYKIVFGLVMIAALGGCQTYADRTWYDPLNLQVDMKPRETKQVQITPSENSFAVRFPSGQATLTEVERRAAAGFLARRAGERTDEVFVDFGILHETTQLAADRRMTMAEIVTVAGLDPARVKVRANVQGIAENEINLTVRRYLVTLPGCPDFTSRAGRTFDNRPHSNWGCATAQNFGMMVAEPRDMLQGRGDTNADAEAHVLGQQRYRRGETRPLQVKDTRTAETFDSQTVSGDEGKK
tara:strand:- start:49408 stop:50157 length:750 start_codon:yes stop_codon:yes gene_type:complete